MVFAFGIVVKLPGL